MKNYLSGHAGHMSYKSRLHDNDLSIDSTPLIFYCNLKLAGHHS
jgi:hypothetical protein